MANVTVRWVLGVGVLVTEHVALGRFDGAHPGSEEASGSYMECAVRLEVWPTPGPDAA